jgi:hypothetical protein
MIYERDPRAYGQWTLDESEKLAGFASSRMMGSKTL